MEETPETEIELYTEKDLYEEFGRIFYVDLLPGTNEQVKLFFKQIQGKMTNGQQIRKRIIERHSEKKKQLYSFLKEKKRSPCSICHYHSENKYSVSDKDYWACWIDYPTVNRPAIHGKEDFFICPKANIQSMEKKILAELAIELSNLYPEDFLPPDTFDSSNKCNWHRLGWVLKDLNLLLPTTPNKGGWDIANIRAKRAEAIVKEYFITQGMTPHHRWIRILCEKGTRFLQHDGLFEDKIGELFLVEVKNNAYGKDGIAQIQKYWHIIKQQKHFTQKKFHLFLVSFHDPKWGRYMVWSRNYKNESVAPTVLRISGCEAHGVTLPSGMAEFI